MQIQSSLPGNRIKVKSGPALLYTKPGGGRAQVSLWEFTEDRSVSLANEARPSEPRARQCARRPPWDSAAPSLVAAQSWQSRSTH